MSKKKQPTRKRKVHVVKVERPSFPTEPTLVTLAVQEPIPLPEVALPRRTSGSRGWRFQ